MVKVKEINVTANYAWSPAEQHPITIACGTAAQQLDATFSTSSSLALYQLNIHDHVNTQAEKVGEIETSNRFHKLAWGNYTAEGCDRGVIVGGSDNGEIKVFNPIKIIDKSEAIVHESSKHTGPVKALDFNPFQKNLFASGASDSEIFIWDLKSPTTPMTPGAKTTPLSAISAVAWNRQVQHILGSASTLNSGPACVVWDLRKNEPVIKVQDPSGRMQCSDISWHPDVATQLVLASEDDHLPVVQLWDLRFATSPLRTMEGHSRGILSASWCPYDPDLLLTCGKDNRVICWNPNATPPEILYELPTQTQWCFDVQWCPRNPNMVSTGSFDGHISVHSLMDAGSDETPQQQNDKIADSFGGGAFTQVQQPNAVKRAMPLSKPPKWIRRPCGATFVFGGKMVSFKSSSDRKTVDIHQVVTETDFVKRSTDLQTSLNEGDLSTFCQDKVTKSQTEFDENIWNFLKVRFSEDARKQYLNLLGYNAEEITDKLNTYLVQEGEVNELESKVAEMSVSDKSIPSQDGSLDGSDAFEIIAANQSSQNSIEASTPPSLEIPTSEDMDGMISQSLLIGDYKTAVRLCIHDNRMADAIILAIAGGPDLLAKTQDIYFKKSSSKLPMLLSSVVTRRWSRIVETCELANWKEALAAVLTYANEEEMPALCDALGKRLEDHPSLKMHACLCYICSGNVGNLVQCWDAVCPPRDANVGDPEALQDLIEKVMILRSAIRNDARQNRPLGGAASAKLAEYAKLLASQGKLEAALSYLPENSTDDEISLLKSRLNVALADSVAKQQQMTNHVAGRQTNAGYNQNAPTSTYNSYQNNTSAVPNNTVNNPYASKRPQGRKAAYSAPTNMYVPSQPATNMPPTYSQPSVQQPPSPVLPSGMAMNQQPAVMQPSVPQPSMPQPSAPQPYMTPGQMPSSMAPAAPMEQLNTPAPPPPTMQEPLSSEGGWNDPPPMNPNRVSKKKKSTPQPIVAQDYNIMTPAPQPEPAQLAPSYMAPGMPPHGHQQMPHVHQQPQQLPFQPMQPNQMPMQQQTGGPQPPAVQSVPTAAPAVEKPPLAQEHRAMQDMFDGLIAKCKPQANNPQIRKKLDDCTRRLDFLYDKLRNNQVSAPVVAGLNQMSKCIEARDYRSGLQTHARIVGSSNFSEISSFMPGLKVLLQIAGQLRV